MNNLMLRAELSCWVFFPPPVCLEINLFLKILSVMALYFIGLMKSRAKKMCVVLLFGLCHVLAC